MGTRGDASYSSKSLDPYEFFHDHRGKPITASSIGKLRLPRGQKTHFLDKYRHIGAMVEVSFGNVVESGDSEEGAVELESTAWHWKFDPQKGKDFLAPGVPKRKPYLQGHSIRIDKGPEFIIICLSR
jgi:hypothetical protein